MRENARTRVALYTDQSFLAEGLASALASQPGFFLAASFVRLADTLAFIQTHGADVLILDLTDEITIPALHSIRRLDPRCRTVIWATAITRELAYQAMEAGVRGILRKSTSPERFLGALQEIGEGDLWFEKDVLESLISGRRVVLTNREGQLVNLLSQGLKNKEIAWTLQISEGTVKVYLSRLFKKLGVNDRFELALYGLKNMQSGFLSPAERGEPAGLDQTRASLMSLRSILIEAHDGAAVEPDRRPVRTAN